MLFGLERLKDSIAKNALSEARVYGDRRLYRRRAARVCRVAGGERGGVWVFAARVVAGGGQDRQGVLEPSLKPVPRTLDGPG